MKHFTLDWWMDIMMDYIHRSYYLEQKDPAKYNNKILQLSKTAQWIEQRIINKYGEQDD